MLDRLTTCLDSPPRPSVLLMLSKYQILLMLTAAAPKFHQVACGQASAYVENKTARQKHRSDVRL